MTTAPDPPHAYPAHLYPGCPCYACDSQTWKPWPGTDFVFAQRMSLCPTCGNKRCPAATDHRNKCTGSNKPGQSGSRFQ